MSTDLTPYEGGVRHQPTSMTEVAQSRAVQGVQAQVLMARRFPRDETHAITKIVASCKRPKLAEQAIYSYPRGGKKVTGPSIRLAEVLARSWGNIEFGVNELEQRNGESSVEAFCHDLETNVRESKQFVVKHERKSGGEIKRLTDPRDIYEMVANLGARRVRSCILGIIPGDIQDMAVEACEKTLAGTSEKPLEDRIRAAVVKFAELGVTQDMLENRLQHKISACNEQDLIALRGIYQSLSDDMSKREDWFEVTPQMPPVPSQGPQTKAEQVSKALPKKRGRPKKEKPAEPEAAAPVGDHPPCPQCLSEFANELLTAETEKAVRAAWSQHVFDHKNDLAPEDYGRGCEIRDWHLKRVAGPEQKSLL